jgi:transcriptional regulator with GAF, ATPase, and Fis domain
VIPSAARLACEPCVKSTGVEGRAVRPGAPGTLFLDEIGDVPLELQSKLLRALQEREIERLGSTRTLRVDFRPIAATNRNLEEMAAKRECRSDLYYRLNVFPIRIPPLRERWECLLLAASI